MPIHHKITQTYQDKVIDIINKYDEKIKRFLFCWQLSPPLNKYLYYFSGVKFENLKKTWIGANCYFDNYDPSLITIESGVCISFRVTIITHYINKFYRQPKK